MTRNVGRHSRYLWLGAMVLSLCACAEAQQSVSDADEIERRAGSTEAARAIGRIGQVSLGPGRTLRIDADRFLQGANELDVARIDPFDNWPSRDAFIVNGKNTFLYASAGALLEGAPVSEARIECSGTMIGCQTFLTAYHCVEEDLDPESYHVYLQTHGIIPVADISGQAKNDGGDDGDLVVLTLEYPVGQVNPVALSSSEPLTEEQTGRIVGFGHTGLLFNDHGIKRAGEIKTVPCEPANDSLICWQYAGELASTCHVDSGGPLYFQKEDGQAVLAGVTSSTDAQCSDETQSIDVNVNHYAEWVASTGGSDVGQLSCGTGSAASEPHQAALTLAKDAKYPFVFDVPAGSTRIVVALNGQEDSSMNFDLEATYVTSGFEVLDTCTRHEPSNFADCHFDTDGVGTKVLGKVIQNGSESGQFQLMISAY